MPETTKDRLREKDNAKREAGGQKADVDAAVDAAQQVDLAAAEIGRASCRERV